MNTDFYEYQDNFLRNIMEDDYVTFNEIVHDVYCNGDLSRSTERSLDDAFEFVGYLAREYGEHLHCSTQEGTIPIKKTPGRLVTWLKEAYYESIDREVAHDIWFELDREAIPPEYLEEAGEESDTTL